MTNFAPAKATTATNGQAFPQSRNYLLWNKKN